MNEYSDPNDDHIDTLILSQQRLQAIIAYRQDTGASLNEATVAVEKRWQQLKAQFPKCFPTDAERSAEAFDRLKALSANEKVTAIEGIWDGDSFGWFIELRALTAETASVETGLRGYGLCQLRDIDRQEERAMQLGTALAATLAVPFRLISDDSPFS